MRALCVQKCCFLALLALFCLEWPAKFVWSALIDRVDVALVQHDEENDIIAETTKPVHCWHLDDKGK